jgi:hypothetical protein
MDLASWNRWMEYSRARDAMLALTDTHGAPWYIVDTNIKRHTQLNVVGHLLAQIPYEDVESPPPMDFPPRPPSGDYVDPDNSHRHHVPDHYL